MFDESLLADTPSGRSGDSDAGAVLDAALASDAAWPGMDAATTPMEAGAEAGSPDAGRTGPDAARGMPGDGDAGGDEDAAAGCGPDAMDCCPQDPDKTAPGQCGCGMPDDDGDGDGTPDCDDACPGDPDKTVKGRCGCGLSEAMAAQCDVISTSLRHRYRFDGSGTGVVDSVGDADAVAVNTTLDGSSTLTLAGSGDQYVDLPDGIISVLSDATFEAWVVWQGGDPWQRIFDFGDSTRTSGERGDLGDGYVMLTPQNNAGQGGIARAAFTLAGPSEEVMLDAAAPLETGVLQHVALVVDDQNELRLYVNGTRADSAPLAGSLSGISDVNNWLGRSQYAVDPDLNATYHEMRIYNAALDDAQVSASFAAGPDPDFLE